MTNIIFYSFFAGSSKYNHKFKAVYNIENEETAFRFTVNVIQWSLIEILCIYLLVMAKYCVKNYFAHGRFPEVGQKQKTEKERKKD